MCDVSTEVAARSLDALSSNEDVKYGEKRTSFEVPQQNKGPLKGFFSTTAAFALSTRDLLQCLCNFLGKAHHLCHNKLDF